MHHLFAIFILKIQYPIGSGAASPRPTASETLLYVIPPFRNPGSAPGWHSFLVGHNGALHSRKIL